MATDSLSSARKVIVQLKATADAPILKQNKFKIHGTDKFAKVIDFVCRQVHRETVFVYINSAFSPNPDELVIDLFNYTLLQSIKTVSLIYQGCLVSDLKEDAGSYTFYNIFTDTAFTLGKDVEDLQRLAGPLVHDPNSLSS